jgi:hypothetical protein
MTDDFSAAKGTPVQAARRQAVLVLSLVLLAGLLIGMAADRLWLTRYRGGRPRDLAVGRGGPGGPRGPGEPGMVRGGFPGPMSPEHAAERRRGMVQRLTRELDLNEAQQQAVDSIMASNEGEFQALEREIRPRMKAFLERTRGQIDSVLTPAQREKFHNFGPPDGPPGPPPGEPGGPPPPEPGR